MGHPIVLITASTPAVAEHVSEALARYAFETITAENEADALAVLASTRRIGVLVADVGAGGLKLAQEARKMHPKIGVIYTAAAPHQIPAGAKVKDAPVLRSPYVAHQLASVISGLGRRVLDQPIAA
jgi:DNA-binding NtrC family response regulator